MKTYARIQSGAIAEQFETEGDITTMFHADLVWIDVTAVTPPPQPGWTYSGTRFAPPPAPDPGPANKAQAQALLDLSDSTILRCAENSVSVPAPWATYRAALRAIVGSGAVPAGGWPVKPAYPAGT